MYTKSAVHVVAVCIGAGTMGVVEWEESIVHCVESYCMYSFRVFYYVLSMPISVF